MKKRIPVPASVCLVPVFFLLLVLTAGGSGVAEAGPPVTDKLRGVIDATLPELGTRLSLKGLNAGSEVYVRIFKIPGRLELWLKRGESFVLFEAYPICDFSGFPGPKIHEGDWQSPEGFYSVAAAQLNPDSQYHLSFNLGFPNEYDLAFGRTGSALMVHGGCSSRGCFAMTNDRVEEIYTLVHLALAAGQDQVHVHVFPFPLTMDNLSRYADSPWLDFWLNLKEGYDAFEQTRMVPAIQVVNRRYLVDRERLARRNAFR